MQRKTWSVPIAGALAVGVMWVGPADAARMLTGKQIKNSSITGTDIKNGSIKKADLAKSARGSAGPTGATGQPGPKGDQGPQGPVGPGVVRVAQVRLAGGPVTVEPNQTVPVALSGAVFAGPSNEALQAYDYGITKTERNPCTASGDGFVFRAQLDNKVFVAGTGQGESPAQTLSDFAEEASSFLLPNEGTRVISATATNSCENGSITLSEVAFDVYRLGAG